MKPWQLRRLKALGLALALLPMEYEAYAVYAWISDWAYVFLLAMIGTGIYLVAYAAEVPYDEPRPHPRAAEVEGQQYELGT